MEMSVSEPLIVGTIAAPFWVKPQKAPLFLLITVLHA